MGYLRAHGHIPVGYYNDPVKTAKTIVTVEGKRGCCCGDEARREETTASLVYGRGSNCIKLRWREDLFREEVEQALKANPIFSIVSWWRHRMSASAAASRSGGCSR